MEAPEKVDYSELNPQIAEVTVGVRSLRKIKIYPLSMADQLKTTDLITEALQAFTAREDLNNDMVFVGFMVELIKDNLAKIMGLATDEDGEKLLEDMTNMQGAAIAEIIFDVNYGNVAKNVKGLVEKIKKAFPSARQSPQLSNIIQDTVLKTSTASPSGTGEPPSVSSEPSTTDTSQEKLPNSN